MPLKCVYLGLGSNIGDRLLYLKKTVLLLEKSSSIVVTHASKIYENRAIGISDGKDFLNAVLEIYTNLSPLELLDFTKGIEHSMGRTRSICWENRTIDIDILYYEGVYLDSKTLKIPHLNLFKRDFVLKPLCELNPELCINDKSVREALCLINCDDLNSTNHSIWPLAQVNQIVAFSQNQVIGIDGKLPWNIEEDWKLFLSKTRDGVLIMGRLSFQEMIKERKWSENRTYIVITSNKDIVREGFVKYASSVEEALKIAKALNKTIWICGGSSIYKETFDTSEMLHLTRIEALYEGDVFYPNFCSAFNSKVASVYSNQNDLKYAYELWKKE